MGKENKGRKTELLLELQEKTKLRSLLLNSKTIVYQPYDFKQAIWPIHALICSSIKWCFNFLKYKTAIMIVTPSQGFLGMKWDYLYRVFNSVCCTVSVSRDAGCCPHDEPMSGAFNTKQVKHGLQMLLQCGILFHVSYCLTSFLIMPV